MEGIKDTEHIVRTRERGGDSCEDKSTKLLTSPLNIRRSLVWVCRSYLWSLYANPGGDCSANLLTRKTIRSRGRGLRMGMVP